ncbi:MAG: isoamylase early set domain-containing protein [Planctomycetota bacterium]
MIQVGKSGEVTFICTDAGVAKKVYVTGDFNGWDPTATRMTRVKDGTFRVRQVLAAGTHEYKFVVDGEWRHDPEAEGQVTNPHGTINSVFQVL